MILVRFDSNPNPKPDEFPDDHRQISYDFRSLPDRAIHEDIRARVLFPRFGRGEQRRSDFAVELDWPDLKRLVTAFIEMEHPEAQHLERALQLVRHIEEAGWYNSDLPEDFWEILP